MINVKLIYRLPLKGYGMARHTHSARAVTIGRGDLYRLDERDLHITVIDGAAWITAEGRDIIASAGETVVVDAFGEPVLISSLRGDSVTVRIVRPQCDLPNHAPRPQIVNLRIR
jgi:hypothetical protein